MPREQHRLYPVIILLALTVAGLTLLALPTFSETNAHEFSAQVTQSELDASIGYAPPGYSVGAHITSQNQVTVTITLVGTSAVLFSQVFSAGTFDITQWVITQITIVNGGNLFLTLKPQNGVFTQMSVLTRIFQEEVTYQYSWIGVLIMGSAGLFSLASFFPQTWLGRAAGRIIPVSRIGLARVRNQIK